MSTKWHALFQVQAYHSYGKYYHITSLYSIQYNTSDTISLSTKSLDLDSILLRIMYDFVTELN